MQFGQGLYRAPTHIYQINPKKCFSQFNGVLRDIWQEKRARWCFLSYILPPQKRSSTDLNPSPNQSDYRPTPISSTSNYRKHTDPYKEWPEANQRDTVWTDGSRLEDKRVGGAVAFKEGNGWSQRGVYLGRNKEVFDAEVFAIRLALQVLDERAERDRSYTIFSDSQAALSRVQHDRTGPGQTLAIDAITTARGITSRGNDICLRWTPSHEGIDGNERADRTARRAAEEREETAERDYLGEASLSHLRRVTTENRANATAEWIRTRSGRN